MVYNYIMFWSDNVYWLDRNVHQIPPSVQTADTICWNCCVAPPCCGVASVDGQYCDWDFNTTYLAISPWLPAVTADMA